MQITYDFPKISAQIPIKYSSGKLSLNTPDTWSDVAKNPNSLHI